MPSGKGNPTDRIAELELSSDRMGQLTNRLPDNHPLPVQRSQARLAKAVAGPGDAGYPTDGNTFWIILLDGSYPKSPGTQSPSLNDRSSVPRLMCHAIDNVLPAQDSTIIAFEINGQFWTHSGGAGGGGGSGDSCKISTPKCCICPPKNNAQTSVPPALRIALCGFPPNSFLDGTHEVKLQGQVEASNSVAYWLFDEGPIEFAQNTSTTDQACWWSSAPSPSNWNSTYDPKTVTNVDDPTTAPLRGNAYRIDVFIGGTRDLDTGLIAKPYLNVTVYDSDDLVLYQFGTWCAFPLGVGFDPTAGIRPGTFVVPDPDAPDPNDGKGIDDATGLYRVPSGQTISGCCTFELEAKPAVGSHTGFLGWHVLPIDVLNICNGLGIPCPLSFYLPARKWEASVVPRASVSFGCGCDGCPSSLSSPTMQVTFADVKALLGYTSGTPNYGSDADAINRIYSLTIAQPNEALQFFEDEFGSPGTDLGIDGAACIWILGKLDPQVPPGTGLAIMVIVKDIADVDSNILIYAHQKKNLNGDPNEVYAIFGAAQTDYLPSAFFDNAAEDSYLKIVSCAPMSESPPRTVWTSDTPPTFANIKLGTEGHSDGTLDTSGSVTAVTSGDTKAVGCQTDFGTIYVASVTRCCDLAELTYYVAQNFYIVGGVYSFDGQCGTLNSLEKYDPAGGAVDVLPTNKIVYHSDCGGCSGACCCASEITKVTVTSTTILCILFDPGHLSFQSISIGGISAFAKGPCQSYVDGDTYPISEITSAVLTASFNWRIVGCTLLATIEVINNGVNSFGFSAFYNFKGTILSNHCPENENDTLHLDYVSGDHPYVTSNCSPPGTYPPPAPPFRAGIDVKLIGSC